jgi:hypothetical protein
MTQTSLGVMVFFTGLLAFFSGSYAVYTTFSGSFLAPVLAIVIGLIYSFMIMLFDREIVSASDKRAVLIRFPLAIVIGFIVAVPLELRLLDDSIQEHLARMTESENKPASDRKKESEKAFKAKKEGIEQEIKRYQDEVNKWGDAMEAEVVGRQLTGRTGKAGAGPAYEQARNRKAEYQEALNNLRNQLKNMEESEDQAVEKIQAEYIRDKHEKSNDFLGKYTALESLKSSSDAAWWVSWGLRMFFILVEVFPAFVKMFLPYNEYNALAEARRRTNIQVIHATSNQLMSDASQDPPVLPQRGIMELLDNQP